MRVRDLLKALVVDDKAAAWDPIGVQIGDPAAEVGSAAVCHEVTEQVVEAVEDNPPDLLLTYHPLLFRPVNRLVAGVSPEGRALRLARSGVNVGVVHTAFDVAAGGAADALAEAVGIEEPSGFGPLEAAAQAKIVTFAPADYAEDIALAMTQAGAGRIGRYSACSFRVEGTGTFLPSESAEPVLGSRGKLNRESEIRLEVVAPARRIDVVTAALAAAHPYEEPAYDVYSVRSNEGFVGRYGPIEEPVELGDLADRLASVLPAGSIRVAGERETTVARAAVVPGSGGGFISAAAECGADVVVTGDVTHHRAAAALDLGVAVIDAGHAPTERPGLRKLFEVVNGLVDARDLTNLNTDPWGV